MIKIMVNFWCFLLFATSMCAAEEMLDHEMQGLYLARLNLSHVDVAGKADISMLDLLIKRHLSSIPFENLNMHLQPARPISIDQRTIIEKLLMDRQGVNRGGYCYEINELFYLLLKSLGFEVSRHKAAVWAGKEPGIIPPPTHQLLTVKIGDMRYVADVAFGLFSIFEAVRLPNALHEENNFTDSQGKKISIKRVMFGEGFCSEQKNQEGYTYSRFSEKKQSLEMISSFTLQSYQANDFYGNNEYVQANYKPFQDNIMFTRFNDQGHMIICVRPCLEFSDMDEMVRWINSCQGAGSNFIMSVR